MKSNKFYSIDIVDKYSRMFMLLFAGIITGSVLSVAYYSIFDSKVSSTIIFLALYAVLFSIYVAFTNSKRNVAKIEVLKDRLAFILKKQGQMPVRQEVLYSNIKQFRISSATSKKNLALKQPLKDKFSLRVYGFRTCIETFDNEKIEFCDTPNDGVLVHSPSYVYRMLDVKRNLENFPLVLENFNSKMDSEDFEKQFEYYECSEKNLPLIKDKKYMFALLRHALGIILAAAIIACIISYFLYKDAEDIQSALSILYIAGLVILVILIPNYLMAYLTPKIGTIANKIARNKIKEVIKD